MLKLEIETDATTYRDLTDNSGILNKDRLVMMVGWLLWSKFNISYWSKNGSWMNETKQLVQLNEQFGSDHSDHDHIQWFHHNSVIIIYIMRVEYWEIEVN